MRTRNGLLVAAVIAIALAPPPAGAAQRATLHEPIPPDPKDDIAAGVVAEGDVPSAIDTPGGQVRAPDPRRPPGSQEHSYAASDVPQATYQADRDTRRPNTLPYDDPFSPATAPFKRLTAFDAVDAGYQLYVQNTALTAIKNQPAVQGDDRFFADLKLDLAPNRHVRVPSVGPGTRVIHAQVSTVTRDVPFQLVHDGADNWFIDAKEFVTARLTMELSIPRAALGGELADLDWAQLPHIDPVPPNVAASAEKVNRKIGVDRTMRPRDAVKKLVAWYRAFADSDDPPKPTADVYSDLALSQKGVCRHRAYAFTISSLALGVPTRMVLNEAHAWVEIHDGVLWHRIDLGGAGRMLASSDARTDVSYRPPADPMPWPPNATPGDDLAERARMLPNNASPSPTPSGGASPSPTPTTSSDGRALAKVTLAVTAAEATRGQNLDVRGEITAEGEPCAGVRVEIVLRAASAHAKDVVVGSLATDAKGAYGGALVVPSSVPLGDYAVHARTAGDVRCGRGESP